MILLPRRQGDTRLNATNAQLVAGEFGVKYFDAPVVDPFQF